MVSMELDDEASPTGIAYTASAVIGKASATSKRQVDGTSREALPPTVPPTPPKGPGGGSDDDGSSRAYDGDMERRVAALEALLPTLATKSDVESARKDFSEFRQVMGEKMSSLQIDTNKLVKDAEVFHEKARAEMTKASSEAATAMQGMRADFHESSSTQLRWIMGTMFTAITVGIGIMTFVLNNATPKAPATSAQAPIIINVPASQQTPLVATPAAPTK